MPNYPPEIEYSNVYRDEKYEYRHVLVPKEMAEYLPRTHRMNETEWRNIGLQQSTGWVHYMVHEPERHVLLFRRRIKKEQLEMTNTRENAATNGDTANCTDENA